jgi:S-DNA-T family DNA segregation ATPase FtsK/SpoIIIE
LLLRQPSRDEHLLAGGDAGTFEPDLPPGSGRWRGAVVQVAYTAGAALPRPLVTAPVRVGVAQHPVLAIVAARPRTLVESLRESGVRLVRLGRDSAGHVDALRVETSPTPTVLLGDPDDWHADWTLLTTARRDWPLVLVGCSVADHRALVRDRDLPPPLGNAGGESWLSLEGRTVRAVLDATSTASSAPESEEKRPPNR